MKKKKTFAGEEVRTLADFEKEDAGLRKHLAAHTTNGNPLVVAAKDGKMPSGVVVCVRDGKGLIAYDADGSGRRLDEVDLASVKGTKPPKAKAPKAPSAPKTEKAPKPEAEADPK